jgi:hypothetical protein
LALDFLIASYNLYKNEDRAAHLDQAFKLSRHYTSIVFEVVKPKESLKNIRKLTNRYSVIEKVFEDFLFNGDFSPVEFIWPDNS